MDTGKEFYKIINKEVLDKVSHAMTSLHSELIYVDKEEAKNIVQDFVEDSKKVINCYIDGQKATLLKLIDLS